MATPTQRLTRPTALPCRTVDRLLYLGYLLTGTIALALASFAIGEGDAWLALRSVGALLSAGFLRTYLQQAGQFDACGESLDLCEEDPSHVIQYVSRADPPSEGRVFRPGTRT